METLTRIAVENNFLEDAKQLKKMKQSQLFEVYDRALQQLSKRLTSNSEMRRKCSGIISIYTTYNLVLKFQQQQKAQSAVAQHSSTKDRRGRTASLSLTMECLFNVCFRQRMLI